MTGRAVVLASIGDTSLISGWFPWLVYVLTPLVLLGGLGWRSGTWKRQLIGGLAFAVAFIVLADALIEVFALIRWDFPSSFYLYAGIVAFALAAAVLGRRGGGVASRSASMAGIVVTAALLGVLINGNYAYYPTFAALFGRVAAHQVALEDLDALVALAASAGHPPSHGVTVRTPVPNGSSGFDARPAYVYLPPAWFATPRPALPMVLLLHGDPGGPENWTQSGEADISADAFAAAHGGLAPILVMPDVGGRDQVDTECVDSRRGRVETYLLDDVVPFARDRFGASTEPRSVAVAGLSSGGFCAAMLALRHPGQIPVFADFSGAGLPTLDRPGNALQHLFEGDQGAFDDHSPTVLLTRTRFEGTAGWFDVGEGDRELRSAVLELARAAEAAGVTTCAVARPGGHSFRVWKAAFRSSLPFLAHHLGLTDQPGDCPTATR